MIRASTRAATLWQRMPQVVSGIRGWAMHRYLRARYRSTAGPLRLCLGSGRAPIDGWTNVDYFFPADVTADLRFGLPFPDNSVELMYSEHLVEHLPLEAALALFQECHRVLSWTGVMRIATPDLEDIIRDYRDDWRRHAWVNWPEYRWIDSGTRMVNAAMREWGHQYLWDFYELRDRLTDAGFADVQRFDIGESERADLRGLETRFDSKLIVEARALKLA